VWGGTDYLPGVLDSWLADPAATFQGVEVDGELIGVHRLRPIAPRMLFYEGLRVASTHRRRGVGRGMVRQAIETARAMGFARIRLITGSLQATVLFESEGFRRLLAVTLWTAGRVEGGELPRLASPGEAPDLAARLGRDPGLAAYRGVNPDWHEVLDVDADLLARLAREGLVRAGASGRAVALLRRSSRERLGVTFAAGSTSALQDLMMGLRVEADSRDLVGVGLVAPLDHPAAEELHDVGYDHVDGTSGYCYVLDLA
jgi:hypothetical protein